MLIKHVSFFNQICTQKQASTPSKLPPSYLSYQVITRKHIVVLLINCNADGFDNRRKIRDTECDLENSGVGRDKGHWNKGCES